MSEHVEPKPKSVKIPGPDHPISVERNASRVVVTVAGRIVADTRDALTLREAHYPAVQYIPRKDVDMALLKKRSTRPTALTRVIASISAFLSGASDPPTQCGVTRPPTPRSQPSGDISPSTPTVSMRSRNNQRSERASRNWQRSRTPTNS